LVILILAVLTFGLAYYAGVSQKQRVTPDIHGISISPPTPAPVIQAKDQAQQPYDLPRLHGHWSLLMLDPETESQSTPGFSRLLMIHNRMATHPEIQQKTHYLYLPKSRETALKISVNRISRNIFALRGSAQQVEETFHQFGVDEDVSAPILYLIGPEAHLHALFTDDVDAATIARDVVKLASSQQ
jgi:cytochrome oxidase Cu insertion factor (SCO1/SenC/PrrC family)